MNQEEAGHDSQLEHGDEALVSPDFEGTVSLAVVEQPFFL